MITTMFTTEVTFYEKDSGLPPPMVNWIHISLDVPPDYYMSEYTAGADFTAFITKELGYVYTD